jgi:hypothetical protein
MQRAKKEGFSPIRRLLETTIFCFAYSNAA